ncbi:MAG TPA: 50S ribosomal protein L11 methyltransferase [Clostridia bacterium]|nr:50S ribosomal protein L11 methyltransferase [Clostridia bacterium]
MKWIELTVYTSDSGLEVVYGALSAAGMEQVALEESKGCILEFFANEKPQWDYFDPLSLSHQNGPCVKAYLADIPENNEMRTAAIKAVERLKELDLDLDLGSLEVHECILDEEDWANAWKQFYKPISVGKRLLICPSWELSSLTGKQTKGRKVLKLDPGMAFGTGAHASTQLCLEFIESKVRLGDKLLDLGCGSGILAISAILLGAQFAFCVDIDPVAIKITKDNMCLNGITSERFAAISGNILKDEGLQKHISGKYDLVVANIVAGVIISLSENAFDYVREGGLFLCSGIIYERINEVKAAIEKAGFILVEEKHSQQDNDADTVWVALLFKRI